MLEDGRLTDGQGRTVVSQYDLDHDLNVGGDDQGQQQVGFSTAIDEAENYNRMKDRIMEQLKHTFRPEFINRVDELIAFQACRR